MYILILVLLFAGMAFAQTTKPIKPYIKKDGTLVQPHVRTAPNRTRLDNYSTKGNTNPQTGKQGTKPAVPPPSAKRTVKSR
jgi:hypothetical protein